MVCNHNYIAIIYGDLSLRELLELKEHNLVYGGITRGESPTHICTKCYEVLPVLDDNYNDSKFSGNQE